MSPTKPSKTGPGARAPSRAHLLGFLLLLVFLPRCEGARHKFYRWFKAYATFYGGSNAQGTMGGACGYGNLYNTGYGTATAAASSKLWAGGKACGGCYQVRCVNSDRSKYCKPGNPSVVVTITNLCPNNWAQSSNDGGWCNYPRKHLDMSQPAWEKLAYSKGGIVPVRLRRVPCIKQGNVIFTLTGNPWFVMVLITNVAASGDIESVSVRVGNSQNWKPLNYNWGAIWTASGSNMLGNSLSFKIRCLFTGRYKVFERAVPANWGFGGSYEARDNFWVDPSASSVIHDI